MYIAIIQRLLHTYNTCNSFRQNNISILDEFPRDVYYLTKKIAKRKLDKYRTKVDALQEIIAR